MTNDIVFNNNLIVNEVKLVEISSGGYEVETEEFKKYHICLKNIPNRCYNEDEGKLTITEKTLMMFTVDEISKLEKIVGGDAVLEEALRTLKNISEDSELISKYENDEIFLYCFERALIDNKERGKKEGKKEGIKEGINETAKRMLKKDIGVDIISEVTGLKIDEIKNLKN